MKAILPLALFVLATGPGAQGTGQKSPNLDCVFPAIPSSASVVLPDGTTVELRLRRTGRQIWHETSAGHPVLHRDGRWVYAQLNESGELVPTGLRLGRDDPWAASLPVRVQPTFQPIPPALPQDSTSSGPIVHAGSSAVSRSQPRARSVTTTGTVKNLVIALTFQNHGPGFQNRPLPTQSDLDIVFNAPGGDPVLAPTGSVADVWLENSYGVFTFDSTVVAWFLLSETEYYFAAGSSGLTTTTWDMIREGLDLADSVVDFSDFDEDGDGRVDVLTILHSGYGAEFGGTDMFGTPACDRIWSHRWAMDPAWTSEEGVEVSDYSISPGLWSTTGFDPVRIGVLAHELGHILGLPDLYDTDGSSIGSGDWELMASGAWAVDNQQRYPSHLSAWSKWKLGWIDPIVLEPGSHVLQPIESLPQAAVIPCGYGVGEYLLLENRQPVGLDALLPGHGLNLWHIDERKGSLLYNDPNGDEGWPGMPGAPLWPFNDKHYRLALLATDDLWELEQNVDRGDSGDKWPYIGIDHIDNFNSPSSSRYQEGTLIETGTVLTNIFSDAGTQVLSFDYINDERPQITTPALPPAVQGAPYFHQLQGAGGIGPYVWSEWVHEPTYDVAVQSSSSFASTGLPQTWNGDDVLWRYVLPFAFPYWETAYVEVFVSSNGYLDFVPSEITEVGGDAVALPFHLRISPLWSDLVTTQPGDDVFIDVSVPGQVTIRWQAHTFGSLQPVNTSVTLFESGGIRFDYGSGNVLDSPPRVGIGRGHSFDAALVNGYDGNLSLGGASSVHFKRRGSALPLGLQLNQDGQIFGTPFEDGLFRATFLYTDEVRNCDRASFDLDVASAQSFIGAQPTTPRQP